MNVSKPESRAWEVFRTCCALPLFLIVTLIFWELALGANLLSRWAYQTGWSVLGLLLKVVALLVAALTVVGTAIVLVIWVGQMVRVIRGSDIQGGGAR